MNTNLENIDSFTKILKYLIQLGIILGFITIFCYCYFTLNWIPPGLSTSDYATLIMIALGICVGIATLLITIISIAAILISSIEFICKSKCISKKLLLLKKCKYTPYLFLTISIVIVFYLHKTVMMGFGIYKPHSTIYLSENYYNTILNEAKTRGLIDSNYSKQEKPYFVRNVRILSHGIGEYTLIELPTCTQNKTFRIAIKSDELTIIDPAFIQDPKFQWDDKDKNFCIRDFDILKYKIKNLLNFKDKHHGQSIS